MVERSLSMREVAGSIPAFSKINFVQENFLRLKVIKMIIIEY